MKLDRLCIATGVVGVTSALFACAYIANGWCQIVSTGQYLPPDSLVEIIKEIFTASVTVLTYGSVSVARRKLENKKVEDGKKIECKTDDTQSASGNPPSGN